jgi:hypothetical protein
MFLALEDYMLSFSLCQLGFCFNCQRLGSSITPLLHCTQA